jgi:hypothetical protein
MERLNPKQAFSLVAADKPIFAFIISLLVVGAICALIVGFNIHTSDVTVYSRYTAFGEAHFYKSHWQYLLLFALFNVIVASAHAAMMMKLYRIERRQTAILIGWVGIVILLVATVYALSVIQLGQAA